MEFRNLKRQYDILKPEIDAAIGSVISSARFIGGPEVDAFEADLADYVGRHFCISCGNGTDAMCLVLDALGIGEGDAVFVPDFTFFATAEVVSRVGASPVFVDIDAMTYNMDPEALERSVRTVLEVGELTPRAVIPVDLFGLPADYAKILPIAKKYDMICLEDGAQGFGGSIGDREALSFGEVSATSFFPVKPLGCYGDGGAVLTDDENLAAAVSSLKVHGQGKHKYDNVRIGYNSRLDAIQAAILRVKLRAFAAEELRGIQKTAAFYDDELKAFCSVPRIPRGFASSYAQYTIRTKDRTEREALKSYLSEKGIPTAVYYEKPLSKQTVYAGINVLYKQTPVSARVSEEVLSLPIYPYMDEGEAASVTGAIREFYR